MGKTPQGIAISAGEEVPPLSSSPVIPDRVERIVRILDTLDRVAGTGNDETVLEDERSNLEAFLEQYGTDFKAEADRVKAWLK